MSTNKRSRSSNRSLDNAPSEKVWAKKSLGQHFLRSSSALSAIVSGSGAKKGKTVFEIGPGEGVLTDALLRVSARVIAVEKDTRLIEPLAKRFEKEIAEGQLMIFEGDIANHEFREHALREGKCEEGTYLLVANIPYYLTGLIIRTFLDLSPRPESMTLLIQEEVAREITAKNGTWGIASVAAHLYSSPRILLRVPRGAFAPPPKVNSAVIHFSSIADPFGSDDERKNFFQFLRKGFQSKRKTLVNNLIAGTPHARETILSLLSKEGITHDVRPEKIPPSLWLRLFRSLPDR